MVNLRINIIAFFLIALLIALQYRLWVQPGGFLEMVRLKKQVALQKAENEKLKERNEVLLQEVQLIQKNKDAVESRARRELGMIKKGEVFYQVIQ